MALRKTTIVRTVSGPYSSKQVITLTGWDATDSFKLQYNGSKTVAFVSGTNGTAAAIQAALRTLTGDASLTVTGTTDAGPFTVTFVDLTGASILDVLTVTDGTGGTTGAVKVNLDRVSSQLKPTAGPYRIFRILTSTTSAGAPTYEVTETAPGTAELADESPADVELAAPGKLVDDLYFAAAHAAANTLSDADTVTFIVYYETHGDRRF